jgi:hypothetical protein
MLPRFFHSVLDALVHPVPQKVHEEIILKLSFLAGPGLDICHIDIVSLENIEHIS